MIVTITQARRLVADKALANTLLPSWIMSRSAEEQAWYLTTLDITVLPPELARRIQDKVNANRNGDILK